MKLLNMLAASFKIHGQFFTVDTTSELAFGCKNQGLPENEIVERVKFIADPLILSR